MKTVYYLQPSSFCFGVQKSIQELEKLIADNPKKKIYCIHELVHNPRISKYLKDLWVRFVQSIYDVYDQDAIIVFSAHGTNRVIISQAEKKFEHVFNLECPFVTKIYREADAYLKDGITTFFYVGKYHHQEGKNIVEYLLSHNVNIYVFDNSKNIPQIDKKEKIGILSQTTLNYQKTKEIFEIIRKKYSNAIFPAPSDICKATYERQQVIIDNINKFKTLVVIGGKESNNGRELYEIWIKSNKQTIFGESLADVMQLQKKELFENETIAVTGGASTPKEDIQEVVDFLITNWYKKEILTLGK